MMRGRNFLRMILALAVAAAVFGGSHAPAAERGPIKIGYFVPLTGSFAQVGRDMVDGLALFWDEVGNQVAGRKVEVIVEDYEAVPATALTKVRRLVEQQKVHTVAGGLLAATGYAVAPYVEQQRMPTIFPVLASDDLTQRKPGRWIMRTSFTGSQVTHPLGEYAYKVMGLRRMASINMDYAYGWESAGGFQRTFEEHGGKIVQKIWFPLNAQDYGPYLASLRKDIDGVYATLSGGIAARFIKQWNEFGLKAKMPLIGTGTATDENVLKGMGDEVLGLVTALIYSAVLDNPANRRFSTAYEKKFARSGSLYSVEGHTAGRIYYEAIKAINGDVEDRERLMQAMRMVEFPDDPRGPMKLDELGNPIEHVYIRKVERVGGKLQNTVIHTYPNVSQFWTYKKDEYLKLPLYDRNYPPCQFCD